jgi:hypothetical protein
MRRPSCWCLRTTRSIRSIARHTCAPTAARAHRPASSRSCSALRQRHRRWPTCRAVAVPSRRCPSARRADWPAARRWPVAADRQTARAASESGSRPPGPIRCWPPCLRVPIGDIPAATGATTSPLSPRLRRTSRATSDPSGSAACGGRSPRTRRYWFPAPS